MKNKASIRGFFCAALSGVCWGFSGTCGQYLFANYDITSLELTCIRLALSGILLFLFSLLRYRDALKNIWKTPKDVVLLILFGLFGMLFNFYAYMTSISYSNAATTTMLLNLNPIVILFITCVTVRRLPRRRETLALALAMFGVFMLATGGNPNQLVLSGIALAWGFSTTFAATAYTLLPRPLLSRWPQIPVLAYGMLIGGAVLNVFAKSWTFQLDLPIQGWLAILAIVFFGSILSFSLFMQGLKDIGPVKTSLLDITEMLSAPIFSAVWLGTRFSTPDYIGFATIIAAVILLTTEPAA